MKAQDTLRDKGLELPVFVPPSDPPWEWGALGFGPPRWLPKLTPGPCTPGGPWFNVIHSLPVREADRETELWATQLRTELAARDRYGHPTDPLPSFWRDPPNLRRSLAEAALVTRLFRRSSGPDAMPKVPVEVTRHKYGRPRIEETRPDHVHRLAWLRDLHDHPIRDRRGPHVGKPRAAWTNRALARALHGDDEDNARKKVIRELAAGRRLLHDHGVLPWVVWHDGSLPANWWLEEDFRQAIRVWIAAHTLLHSSNRALLRRDEEVCHALHTYILHGG